HVSACTCHSYVVCGAMSPYAALYHASLIVYFFFFFQAEDGIRDWSVTGVQTCALPISPDRKGAVRDPGRAAHGAPLHVLCRREGQARAWIHLATLSRGHRRCDRLVQTSRISALTGQSAGSWRSRKNLKNSMPSRSRRRKISGLLTISPAMAAIFGARK